MDLIWRDTSKKDKKVSVMGKMDVINLLWGVNIVLSKQFFKQERCSVRCYVNHNLKLEKEGIIHWNDTLYKLLGVRKKISIIYNEIDWKDIKVILQTDCILWSYSADLMELRFELDLYTPAQISQEKIYNTGIMIAEQITRDFGKEIKYYEVILAEDKKRIQTDFYGPNCKFQDNIISALEEQAIRNRNRVAIECKEKSIEYGELNEIVNKVARCLCAYGIRKGDITALVMDRNEKAIIVCLALWKIGACYLPVTEDTPMYRIRNIIETNTPACLITDRMDVCNFFEQKHNVIALDNLFQKAAQFAGDNPPNIVSKDMLSYIINTSGSTGTPKGVMIEQAGMMNHIDAMTKILEIDENSVIAQTASIGFDISIWQMFTAIVKGARVIIIPDDVILDVFDFVEKLRKSGVTDLEIVPSYLKLLLECVLDLQPKYLRDIKNVIVTGEHLDKLLIEKWYEVYPGKPLYNAYGPAEASDDVTFERFTETYSGTNVSIGKTIQNMRVFILDENLTLCPIGIPGEICISGVGLARGYINDPDKTNKAFLCWTNDKEGVRIYRTGDFGRWTEDGRIEFLGRFDEQVKIRGFRIELNEIKITLMQNKFIIDVAMVYLDKELPEIVAFVVLSEAISSLEIRDYLSEKLPHYMVPNRIIIVDFLPLNRNGKINRKKLIKDFIEGKKEYEE